MANPSIKHEGIESFLTGLTGGDRRVAIAANLCFVSGGGCGENVNDADFSTDLACKEYTISGLCQKCQKELFGS